jgi:hypothetical protein
MNGSEFSLNLIQAQKKPLKRLITKLQQSLAFLLFLVSGFLAGKGELKRTTSQTKLLVNSFF